ncbi:hypothetical protein E4T66_01820 [Sinimarinibacterium sp. CAU 1509]|uniref:hypothetical protein n=1 Tax=Sinimarinibacterium sp. CAU 1509 TaxID=2562283 RepID=UPI0010AD6882|nr:hypothetical protein [Sinimarinibacterium sp. CAU 1509]TJY64986.1 hypothetical protein E4T66_01820 [Sinimarinibacterium sp. CAU 1509]
MAILVEQGERFPKVVYDALPVVYILVGVMTLFGLDSGLRVIPATLLIIAGLLVRTWRRQAAQPRRRPIKRDA